MSEEIKQLHEIKDLSVIDFESGEWSWGFGYDQYEGFLYYTVVSENDPFEFHTIKYVVPKWMATMITQVREVALHNLKIQLRGLDIKRAELLDLKT